MKYENEVIIAQPKDKVVALIQDPDQMKNWQPTLEGYEHLSGEPGEPGAKMKLIYGKGGNAREMVETIISTNWPDSLVTTYETKGVFNRMESYFEVVDETRTRYRTVSEFRFSGFMKLIGLFFKGAFPKETQKTLEAFKELAEKS